MNKVQLFHLTHLVLLTTLRLDVAQSSRCALYFAELYSPNLTIEKTSHSKHPSFVVKAREKCSGLQKSCTFVKQLRGNGMLKIFSLPSHLPNAPFSFNLKVKLLDLSHPSIWVLKLYPNTPHTLCGQGWLQSKALQHPAPWHPTATMARTKGWHRIDLLRVPSNQMGALGCLQHNLRTEKIKVLQAGHSTGRELNVSVPNTFETNPDVLVLLHWTSEQNTPCSSTPISSTKQA